MHPADVDPESRCRLPLPEREELDAAARAVYDRLADPSGGTLRGLRGPGGITLHSVDEACLCSNPYLNPIEAGSWNLRDYGSTVCLN